MVYGRHWDVPLDSLVGNDGQLDHGADWMEQHMAESKSLHVPFTEPGLRARVELTVLGLGPEKFVEFDKSTKD